MADFELKGSVDIAYERAILPANHNVDFDERKLREGMEQAYIPLSLARRRIAQLSAELQSMKKKHLQVVDDISASYEEVIRDNRESFEKTLQQFRDKAQQKLGEQKGIAVAAHERLRAVEATVKQRADEWLMQEQQLRKEIEDLLREQDKLLKRIKDAADAAEAEQSQHEAIKRGLELYIDVLKNTIMEKQEKLKQLIETKEDDDAKLERCREMLEDAYMKAQEDVQTIERLMRQMEDLEQEKQKLYASLEMERENKEKELKEREEEYEHKLNAVEVKFRAEIDEIERKKDDVWEEMEKKRLDTIDEYEAKIKALEDSIQRGKDDELTRMIADYERQLSELRASKEAEKQRLQDERAEVIADLRTQLDEAKQALLDYEQGGMASAGMMQQMQLVQEELKHVQEENERLKEQMKESFFKNLSAGSPKRSKSAAPDSSRGERRTSTVKRNDSDRRNTLNAVPQIDLKEVKKELEDAQQRVQSNESEWQRLFDQYKLVTYMPRAASEPAYHAEEWKDLRRLTGLFRDNKALQQQLQKATEEHKKNLEMSSEIRKRLKELQPEGRRASKADAETEEKVRKLQKEDQELLQIIKTNAEAFKDSKALYGKREEERTSLKKKFNLDDLKDAEGQKLKISIEELERLLELQRERERASKLQQQVVEASARTEKSSSPQRPPPVNTSSPKSAQGAPSPHRVGTPPGPYRVGTPSNRASGVPESVVKARLETLQSMYEAEIANKTALIASLKKQVESMRAAGNADSRLQKVNELLDSERADFENKSQALNKLNKELHTQVGQYKEDLSTKQSEITALKKSVANIQTELEQVKKFAAQMTPEQAEKLKSDLASFQDKARQSQALLDKLQSSSKSQLEELKKGHVEEMDRRVNELSKQHADKLAELSATISRVSSELATEKQERERVQGSLDAETKRRFKTEEQLSELTTKHHALVEDTAEHQKRLDLAKAESAMRQSVIDKQAQELTTANETIDVKTKENEHMFGMLQQEQQRRKMFQFKYEEVKGKVRVYARCRPMNRSEREKGEKSIIRSGKNTWTVDLNETQTDVLGNVTDKWREFTFDAVFLAGTRQEEVFEECKVFCEMAMQGVNCCIFAYGQSGTGKTFTMAGERPNLLGLKPRMVNYAFQMKDEQVKTHDYEISCYMVEIYLNKVYDIFWKLDQHKASKNKKKIPDAPELKIQMIKGKVNLLGVTSKEFKTAEEMNTAVDEAEFMRITRKTGLNENSSRSHLVFAVMVKSKEKSTGKTTYGKLSLVDLAGSERANKTNVDGLNKDERELMLTEGKAINESLRMLKNIFRVLGQKPGEKKATEKAEVVQYRGNALTELMQDSLGGNARTLMFVNVGPAASNISESIDSLQYGDLVQNISNQVATADADLQAQVRDLSERVKRYMEKYGDLPD